MGRMAGVNCYCGWCWVGVVAAIICGGLLGAVVGCTAPRPKPNIADADPSVSIPGIKIAAERNDVSAAPALVKQLDSDDPAIRFYAIGALTKFTAGEKFGYEYYYDEEQRKPSLAKWQQWLKSQPQQQQEQVQPK
jgi:hypothetical protein